MFDINGKDNSTYNIENIELIKKASPKVGEFIEKEYYRQKNNVESISSKNMPATYGEKSSIRIIM